MIHNFYKIKKRVNQGMYLIHLYINECVVAHGTESTRPVSNWAYTHCILGRPEYNHFYSSDSVKADEIIKVLSEIFNYNESFLSLDNES